MLRLFGRLMRWSSFLFVYFCVGTVIAAIVLLGDLWRQGSLTNDRVVRALAAWYGVDGGDSADAAQASITLDDVREFSESEARNLELREESLRTQLLELMYQIDVMERKRRRYQEVKKTFDAELQALRDEAASAGLRDIRSLLQNIKPDLAKDRIMAMTKDDPEKGFRTIVLILRGMGLDEKSAIFEKFQTLEEQAAADRILEMLAEGRPETDLINSAEADAAALAEPP